MEQSCYSFNKATRWRRFEEAALLCDYMDLQALSGQLYVKDGQLQAETAVPGLLVQFAPRKAARGRERDTLFVHLSLSGQPAETAVLAQDLLDGISGRYFSAGGSITASLRKAIQQANERLLHLNLNDASVRYEGAISCAVLRGSELYVVQAGEAIAMLGRNFGIEPMPNRTPDRIVPLGRTAGVDLRYFHFQVQAGDLLLFSDPRLGHYPAQTFAPVLVDVEIEVGLEALLDIIGAESARMLLVEFTDEPVTHMPAAPVARAQNDGPLATLPQPLPQRESGLAIPPGEMARRPQPQRPLTRSPMRIPEQISQSLDVERAARQATAQAAFGLARFTGWLASLLTRLRPQPRPEDSEDEQMRGWALPTLLAILIPIVVGVIVTTVYLEQGRGEDFLLLRQQMQQNLGLAQQSEDVAESYQYYQTVLAMATQADQLRPGDSEVAQLRAQALAALDELDGTERMEARLYYEFDESVSLTAVTLRDDLNGGIYLLDSANNQVFFQPTNEVYEPLTSEPERILFGGQVLGSHVIGNMIDIMWRPRGASVSRDGLAVLDGSGALLSYYTNFGDVVAVPLGLASQWQLPSAITTFGERLYILDTGAGEIWKYFPDGDGFFLNDDERTLFFAEDANLQTAVDIALYLEDGSLAVAYADGQIRYYDTAAGRVRWDEGDLLANGLRVPMQQPVAIELVGQGLSTSVFIADGGNGRIVQASRPLGLVLNQFRALDENGTELFTQISDFAVINGTPLRIFVTAGNRLYLVGE